MPNETARGEARDALERLAARAQCDRAGQVRRDRRPAERSRRAAARVDACKRPLRASITQKADELQSNSRPKSRESALREESSEAATVAEVAQAEASTQIAALKEQLAK